MSVLKYRQSSALPMQAWAALLRGGSHRAVPRSWPPFWFPCLPFLSWVFIVKPPTSASLAPPFTIYIYCDSGGGREGSLLLSSFVRNSLNPWVWRSLGWGEVPWLVPRWVMGTCAPPRGSRFSEASTCHGTSPPAFSTPARAQHLLCGIGRPWYSRTCQCPTEDLKPVSVQHIDGEKLIHCLCGCTYVRMCKEARGQPWVSFVRHHPSFCKLFLNVQKKTFLCIYFMWLFCTKQRLRKSGKRI